MANESYLFSFLEPLVPVAALNAKKMEEYIFTDASTALIKARLFAEEILKEVFKKEEIDTIHYPTLYDKISFLSREGIIRREIQKSFDSIRLAGNKAAHNGEKSDFTEALKIYRVVYDLAVWFCEVYSNEFITIPAYENPKPHVKSSIELDKNLINDLISEKITSQIKELFEPELLRQVLSLKKEYEINESGSSTEENESVIENKIILQDLKENQSYLYRELKKLQDSAQEAVENANSFSQFKEYMHVERKIQKDLEEILEKSHSETNGKLILLCGSVGDGKSHLLAYLKKHKSHLLKDFRIYNDATESFSPNKNALETLREALIGFSDEHINNNKEKVILAINLGVLHNFITADHGEITFNKLKDFIEESGLFSQNITSYKINTHFGLISFADYQSFEITEQGPVSSFYSSIMKKIFNKDDQNPFYMAYKLDRKREYNSITHQNYLFLMDEQVQSTIIQLIIQAIVKYKLVISARAFMNFLADIIIPEDFNEEQLDLSNFERLERTVPNLLFTRKDRSQILKNMSELDPIHCRSSQIDQLIISLNTLNDWNEILDRYILVETGKKWLSPFVSSDSLTDFSFDDFSKSLIRLSFLTNEEFSKNVTSESYVRFMNYLYSFHKGHIQTIKDFYEEIKNAIFLWKGSPKKGYIYINKPTEKFRIAQLLNLKPSIEHIKFQTENVLYNFKLAITLAYHGGNTDNTVFLDIDYPLYSLLLKVQNGYCPSKKDEEDAIKFVEFLEKIMEFGNKKEEVIVHIPHENKLYKLKKDDFGSFVFERE
jgi:DNA phosphorothioation-dependent restriction protein DptF